ncbi:MAG: non-ribosomal peptide synthetase [Rhodobacteraceae bacterium]|nr:MAG: non-ribosomal peptide synthetase [Paracoccaceae bacterium]
MNDAAQRIMALSPRQRALLRDRLAARKAEEARTGETDAPLSFAQERWIFNDRMSPGDPAHAIFGALRLTGDLSEQALQASLDGILSRHAVLRSAFVTRDGETRAQSRALPGFPLERLDLTQDHPEAAREALCHRRYREETETGFDLARDLPIRAVLVRLGPRAHVLMVTMHHIVSDGWSLGIFMEEFARIYIAAAQGLAPDLPVLAISYADFARRQRRELPGPRLQRGMAYWRGQLADPPPLLDLPPDLPGDGLDAEGQRCLGGAATQRVIDAALKARLTEVGQAAGASLFATLLTAYFAVLMRLTRQSDLIVGTPVSGRMRQDTEPLIGLFLNTLALRVRLNPSMRFHDALEQVQATLLGGLEHHEIPFDQVVQEIAPARAPGDHALFELMFNFTPSPARSLDLPGLRADFAQPPTQRCEFSNVVYVTEWEGALEVQLAYQKARYSAGFMAAVLRQYEAVLRQVAADPEVVLGALDLRALDERVAPGPPPAEAAQVPVTRRIAEVAARHPDAPAVSGRGGTLDYRAFVGAMQAVAQQLNQSGIGPGDVVAVAGPRCPGYIVAMAAVLEAGAVLLTLAPDLPRDRRRIMLSEAGACHVLRCGAGAARAAGLAATDLPEDGRIAPPGRPPDSRARAGTRDPAYVFFTSGSSGTPKAVLGSAGGLAQFLSWQRETFQVGPGDRAAQMTGMSFDVVLRDVFLPLTSGAELVLPDPGHEAASGQAPAWLEAERITLVHSVPSVLQTWLLDPAGGVTLPALRLLFSAGEPLQARLVQDWRARFPVRTRIVNLYGPTETVLAKFWQEVPDPPYPGVQPVGHALPGAEALVLSDEGRPCAIGEPGEVAIRTPYRSLGYANAPERTAQSFRSNPVTGDAEDILYFTGDLGYLRADGALHLLGRLDDQIKINGIRTDPREIASVLRRAGTVADCVVIARKTAAGAVTLAAYAVAKAGTRPSVQDLRDHLRRRLPAALVPGAIALIEALPLGPNGKLDRSRLPEIDAHQGDGMRRAQPPRSATELQMLQIWQALLERQDFGVRDDFFDLGGHSLLSLRLLLMIERKMGVKIPLAELFRSATIEHLARVAGRVSTPSTLVPLWPQDGPGGLCLVHTGGGGIWNYLPLVRALAPAYPVHALQARGLFDGAPPHADIPAMAADYLADLRRVQPNGPYRLAGHSFGGVVAYEMARQLRASGQEVARLVLFDSSLARPDDAWVAAQPAPHAAARDLAGAAEVFARFTGADIALDEAALRARPIDAQIALVAAAFSASDSAMPGGDAGAMVAGLLAIARAHRAARLAYRPGPCDVPITLFLAEGSADPGWARIARQPVEVIPAAGDHVTMMTEAHAAGLAAAVQRVLA